MASEKMMSKIGQNVASPRKHVAKIEAQALWFQANTLRSGLRRGHRGRKRPELRPVWLPRIGCAIRVW